MSMAHDAAPELLKQTSLQWLTHVVAIHLRSGTILNPEISLLNLIRQEKVTDVDSPGSLARACFPLFSNRMVDLLSWYKMFSLTSYPCSSIKNLVQRIICAMSSAPTSSDSVLLLVFNFCFLVLEVQLVQLVFHKGQVCTCEQVEV